MDAVIAHLAEKGFVTRAEPAPRVHVTRLDGGAGRHEGDVEIDGVRCAPPVRAAIESGLLGTPETSLVTADSLARNGLATHAELGR